MIDGSADLYNHLPQLVEVRLDERAIRTAGRAVSPLIEYFGAADYVAIVLAHRHFELREGQIVAWSDESGMLRLRPRVYLGAEFVPVAWKLSNDQKITPIEYASASLVPTKIMTFLSSTGFLKFRAEFLARLQSSPLGSVGGISFTPQIFSNFFAGTSVRYQMYEETLDQAFGSMRIAPRADGFEGLTMTGSKDLTTTMWMLRAGRIQILAGCPACSCIHAC
jgi:hypothetical protein